MSGATSDLGDRGGVWRRQLVEDELGVGVAVSKNAALTAGRGSVEVARDLDIARSTVTTEARGAPLRPASLLSKTYRRAKRIHLILDNYGIHSAALTKQTLLKLRGRIVLHFLPPYCPDANRIERVWQDLHANVTRNHRCKTMTHLLANARTYLTAYVWRHATGTAPILSASA